VYTSAGSRYSRTVGLLEGKGMADTFGEIAGENVKPKEDEEDGARTLYLFER